MHIIRPMTVSDITEGMRLKTEAGWNQVESDWGRFLTLGIEGCFVAEREGRVVGSVTSCRFGAIAWIAMLLVEKASRGTGIGRSLLVHCLEQLESTGVASVRLDATALGRPLYESIGFRVDFHLNRYQGNSQSSCYINEIRQLEKNEITMIADFDRKTTGTDRCSLLRYLFEVSPRESLVRWSSEDTIGGFAFWRPGSSAVQIGPCIAEPTEGEALLESVSRRLAGREVIIDIPSENPRACAWAEGGGLTRSREFWRMTRGESVIEDLDRLWASSGPEMG